MTETDPGITDRETIAAAVSEADRRLRGVRFVRDLFVIAQVVLGLALALVVLSWFAPWARPLANRLATGGLLAAGLVRAAMLVRRRADDEAAAALDKRAGLRDGLRSAHWFVRHGPSGPWYALQVARAARAVATLHVGRLLPLQVPRRPAVGLLMLAALFAAAGRVPPGVVRDRLAASHASLSAGERTRIDALERTIDEAALDEARRARIAVLLTRLREETVTPEETAALLAELQALLDARAGDLAGTRRALDRLADALAADERTRELSEALRGLDLEAAARALREMAESSATTDRLSLASALEGAARQGTDPLERLPADLDAAAGGLRANDDDDTRRAFDQAITDLDELQALRDGEEPLEDASRQVQEIQRAAGQRFRPGAGGEQLAQAEAPPQAGSADDTDAEGAVPMPGQGRGRPAPGEAGQQPGSARGGGDGPGPLSAPAPGQRGPSAPVRPPEVTRRQEVLSTDTQPAAPSSRELIRQRTRAGRATVEYRPVAPQGPYADAEPVTAEGVPWPYRELVKTYFQVIGPRGGRNR